MISQGLSTFANSLIALVIPWIVLYRTGSAFDAGIVAFCTGIAGVIGSLAGGVLIDYFGAKKIAIISDVISALTVTLIPVCLFFSVLPLELLIIIQVVGTFFDGPAGTARDTMVPTLAKKTEVSLLRATSAQEAIHGMSGLLGPLVGGSLLLSIGAHNTLWVTVAAFVVSAAAIRSVPLTHTQKNLAHMQGIFARVYAGFLSLKKDTLLWSITVFNIIFTSLFTPLLTLILPAWFAKTHTDTSVLTTFLAIQASGFICGSLLYTYLAKKISQYTWIQVSSLANFILLCILIFHPPTSSVFMYIGFLLGLFSAGLVPIISTLYYARTHPDFLGRINGTSAALVQIVTSISLLIFGFVTDNFGPIPSLFCVVAGTCILALYAYNSRIFKKIDTTIQGLSL